MKDESVALSIGDAAAPLVGQSRYPEERWRAIAADMRKRSAKITDEELERPVE